MLLDEVDQKNINDQFQFSDELKSEEKSFIGVNNPSNDEKVKCEYCGNETKLVWVHGHGQCEFCKTNIDEETKEIKN